MNVHASTKRIVGRVVTETVAYTLLDISIHNSSEGSLGTLGVDNRMLSARSFIN